MFQGSGSVEVKASSCSGRRELLRRYHFVRKGLAMEASPLIAVCNGGVAAVAEFGELQCVNQCVRKGYLIGASTVYRTGDDSPVFGTELRDLKRSHRSV